MISPTFVEANYEVLESLLRERRKQMHNEDLRTELEYFSEEYEEEREMEPRPARIEDAPNRDEGRVERNSEGGMHSKQRAKDNRHQGGNLRLPSLWGICPQAPMSNNILTSNGFMYSVAAPSNNYPFYTQPMHPLPNTPAYPNHEPTGLFMDSTGCVTPFVHWIEDYPLPDGLKIPSHVGSYDRKGDPNNYLHLFEDSTRIWWNGQKASSILNYEDLKAKFQSHFIQQKKFTKIHLAVHNIKQKEGESTRAFVTRFVHELKTRSLVEFLSTDLPTTYKDLMEKTYTWIEAREVATNGTPKDHRESFDRFKKNYSWDNNKGKKNRDRFSLYRGSNHGLLSNLSKSPREILATEKVEKTFEQPPRLIGSRWSRDMSKYCHFHEDHGNDTNQCRELKHQIEKAVKSGQLAHLVKGIKKGKAKVSDSQLGEWRKGDRDTAPIKSPILMISREDRTSKRRSMEKSVKGIGEITFPPVSGINDSSDPVIIKV
ncbi:hypothetical protein Tco_0116743 [Tanacetum coccineum]